MISTSIRRLLETVPYVFVATSNPSGQPHIAISELVVVSGDSLLTFENLFCPTTLQNISANSRVAVVAFESGNGTGYQLVCSIVRNNGTMLPGGSAHSDQGSHPVLTRFTVKVHQIMEFSGGIHSDIPISD